MAEVLGVVASGIAVTQLADQFVRSIHNLHTFWRDVKGAPKSVGNILEELEILGLILQSHLIRNQNTPTQCEDSAITRCFEHCNKTAGSLEATVAKLKLSPDANAGRRRWNSIKGAFMKGEIQDIQARLDRAKEMLNMAMSACSLAIQQKSILLLQVDRTTSEQANIPTQSPTNTPILTPNAVRTAQSRPRRVRKNTHTYKTWWFPGYLQSETIACPTIWQDDNHKSTKECDKTTQWKLVPASWLRPKHLFFDFGGNSWKYSFKLARTVPFDSEVFDACWDRDIEKIIELFKSGLATINDVLPDGETLLHCAARANRPHVCDWLITQGVDCNAVDEEQLTPLHILNENVRNFQANLDCARILVEKAQIDPLSTNNKGRTCLEYLDSHTSLVEYLIYSQQHFSVDYSQISNETLLQAIGISHNVYSPLVIRRIIGNRDITFDLATEIWGSEVFFGGPKSFLIGAARRLSCNFDYYGVVIAELEFIFDLIKSGADVHFQTINGITTWDLILDINFEKFEANKECLIISWLSCLHKAGINLVEYFRKEENLHEHGKMKPLWYYRKSITRIFKVYYGDRDDDIIVRVEDMWDQTEHPSCPGAWDEELEHAEARGLEVLEGQEPSTSWSVTTSGFRDGDYSAIRAGCDPELPKRQRAEFRKSWKLPDLECLY